MAEQDRRSEPRPRLPGKVQEVEVGKIERLVEQTVPLSERTGVYVHSFQCMKCCLHFALFSWVRGRHKVGTVACPECRERGRLMHSMVTLNEHAEFTADGSGGTEIFELHPWPGSERIDDGAL